jgi:hypothetical protein
MQTTKSAEVSDSKQGEQAPQEKSVYKRDGTNMYDYYRAWDQFNPVMREHQVFDH